MKKYQFFLSFFLLFWVSFNYSNDINTLLRTLKTILSDQREYTKSIEETLSENDKSNVLNHATDMYDKALYAYNSINDVYQLEGKIVGDAVIKLNEAATYFNNPNYDIPIKNDVYKKKYKKFWVRYNKVFIELSKFQNPIDLNLFKLTLRKHLEYNNKGTEFFRKSGLNDNKHPDDPEKLKNLWAIHFQVKNTYKDLLSIYQSLKENQPLTEEEITNVNGYYGAFNDLTMQLQSIRSNHFIYTELDVISKEYISILSNLITK